MIIFQEFLLYESYPFQHALRYSSTKSCKAGGLGLPYTSDAIHHLLELAVSLMQLSSFAARAVRPAHRNKKACSWGAAAAR